MVKKRGNNLPVQNPMETEPTCKHIQKGVKEGLVKKALVNVEWNVCQDCHTDGKEKASSEDKERDVIWICLKCGHRGCGRYSEQQHALKHYNTPRSEPHCLVLSVGDWNVWCYLCDNQVDYNSSGPLRQLVEYIQKKSKSRTANKDNKGQAGEDLCIARNIPEKETHHVDEDSTMSTAKVEKTTSPLNDGKEITVKGLSNLGNTCFFNAVMQNLSQTPALRELLNEVKLPGRTVQVPNTEPSCQEMKLEQQPGPLTLAMWQFLTEMKETKKGVVTPKELFSQVCKKAARFRGYQQQDSQELLRYLLDGMRGEEIQVVSSTLSKMLQDSSDKMDEEEVKKVVKECEKKRVIPNFVDRLFGGELTSTIMCETCCTVSLVHEPFLDLSLPVRDDTPPKKSIPKTLKDNSEQKNEKKDDHGGYVKEKTDMVSGTSKPLQRKAKKQAKKQAKTQRQQQKLQEKKLQICDPNVDKQDEEDSVCDNNTLDNNARPQEEPSADVSLDKKCDVEKSEDPSEQESETCINNMDIKSENLNEHVEDQKDDHEWRPRNLDDTRSSSGTTDDSSEPSDETIEIQENGEIGQIVDNGQDQYENLSRGLHTEDEYDDLTKSINRLNLNSGLESSDIEIKIIDDPPSPPDYGMVNEDSKMAFCTLSDREKLQLDDWSVLGCLNQFTRKESLVGNNQLLCTTCTQRQAKAVKNTEGDRKFVYTNAKKQMLVSVPPPILTLHLKRFQQNGYKLQKMNKHIKFSEVIDLAPFCTAKCKNIRDGDCRLLYALYGVIEHSGSMRSGHYTAYVKSRTPNPNLSELVDRGLLPEELNTEPTRGHWYYISDSHVQAVPLSEVLSSQAYLLFYERML